MNEVERLKSQVEDLKFRVKVTENEVQDAKAEGWRNVEHAQRTAVGNYVAGPFLAKGGRGKQFFVARVGHGFFWGPTAPERTGTIL